jgi:hypothetical protein
MKTSRLILLVAGTLVLLSTNVVAREEYRSAAKSTKPGSPRTVVIALYNQHKRRSPFFQTRSRALLNKYFVPELADLLWKDAHSSGDEVGALDGDPLFNAQDMEIKNFLVHEGTVAAATAEVPVSFENFGQKHQVTFRLAPARTGWKIADIAYDDGSSLVEILKHDRDSAANTQTVKVYLVAVGDDGRAGKKIGCGDSVIAVTRAINKTAAPLKAALIELLSTPSQASGTPKLENFWKGRNLKLQSVSIRSGTATIYLSGKVFVAGVCDVPRIESQIEETARQFSTVKKVKVFIGKQTLAQAIR